MVQNPPLCLGGGGVGARGRRGACGLGAMPFMPGHDAGGIASLEARHAGDTPTGGS